jgi:hypothetical protein
MYKVCSKCNKHKDLNNFHKLQKGLFGKHSICKECRKAIRLLKKESNKKSTNIDLICSCCSKQKHCSEFYINRSSNYGYQSYCKNCQKKKISESMSKLENYIKIILKKFKKKFKKKKITLTSQDIINKYNDQCGYCSITKHKMTHNTDIHQRTDNIWNMSIYADSEEKEINKRNFKLVIHFVYTAQNLYKMTNEQILNLYKNIK